MSPRARAFGRAWALLAVTAACALTACSPRQARRDRDVPEPPVQTGIASWYGEWHQGKLTANGERFDKNALTAAHPKLRFGTCVRVKNLGNGREVQVRVNDRGPYAEGRIIDLSEAAAKELRMAEKGVAKVELRPCR